LLILLRDKAKEAQNLRFADEINNTLLVNQYKDGADYYKLMPTQTEGDRQIFQDFINCNINNSETLLTKAYNYFDKKLKQVELESEKLKKIITSYFSVVSIVLDVDDNPYLVFESLNAKGKKLEPADLIRNYFFMRIHIDKQEEVNTSLLYILKFWQSLNTIL